MKKIISLLSKIIAFIYIYFKSLATKKLNISNDKILIITADHIGDALLHIECISKLTDYYTSIGKQIYIMCIPTTKKCIEMIMPELNAEYLSLNFSHVSSDFKWNITSIRKLFEPFNNFEFEKIIVLQTGIIISSYAAAYIKSNEKWGIPFYYSNKWILSGQKSFRNSFCYTNIVKAYPESSLPERGKLLAMALGVPEYKTHISYIPKQCDFEIPQKEYITVAVDSMNTERRWPVERFIELIHRLLEKYEYNIYLTGSNIEDNILHQYISAFDDSERVNITIGKLDMKEWIELIRYSQFHIGVDSGSIHVAASVGTLAFCLIGYWDGRIFFPYKFEESNDNTINPVCVYSSKIDPDNLACFACRYRGGSGSSLYRKCRSSCKKGGPLLCLLDVQVEDVLNKINEHIRDNKI